MLNYGDVFIDDLHGWVEKLAIEKQKELQQLTHLEFKMAIVDNCILVEGSDYHENETIRAETSQEG